VTLQTPIEIATRYSKANAQRMLAMQNALRRIDAAAIPGDVVECGVWKGGHIILARLISPQRRCWLFDTFTGMTEPTAIDVTRGGTDAGKKYRAKKANGFNWDKCTLGEVRGNLAAVGVFDADLVRFVVGDVCETLQLPGNVPEQIALLRLDTDWYESTKVELEVLWPRLVKGGAIIIDDYGHWMGARQAVQEFFARNVPDFRKRLNQIDYTAAIMVK
jgi:O-methyltransferase